MGTPLQIIFNKFLNLIDDIELSLLSEQDINEMLEPIMPKLKVRADDIINKVKSKYSNVKENDVLE